MYHDLHLHAASFILVLSTLLAWNICIFIILLFFPNVKLKYCPWEWVSYFPPGNTHVQVSSVELTISSDYQTHCLGQTSFPPPPSNFVGTDFLLEFLIPLLLYCSLRVSQVPSSLSLQSTHTQTPRFFLPLDITISS